jgi:hypothetical protein
MPHFVTRIIRSRRAPLWMRTRGVSHDDGSHDARGYRRRLARLRAAAPDTLRARVRRELSAAAAAISTRAE